MTMEIITAFITAPDENGCDVYSSFNLVSRIPYVVVLRVMLRQVVTFSLSRPMTLPNLLMHPAFPKPMMEASQKRRMTFVEVLRIRSSVRRRVVMDVSGGRMDVL